MFEKILTQIATTLDKKGIPYMIIGGQAVLLYGTPRLTKDIDITLGIGIDRLEDIKEAIEDMNLKIIPKEFEDFVKRTFVLPTQEEKSGIRVDFIFSYTPYERQAISRIREIELQDIKVKFASLEDVIIHKIFSGRPKDLEDVRSMIIKNPHFDSLYIINWLKKFTITSKEKKLVQLFKNILKSTR